MALDYPEEHRREALAITRGHRAAAGARCVSSLKFNGPNPPLTDTWAATAWS
ncbi:MAG: hypothetical protein WKG07_29780 [Hymenobacter sp.]